jgi:hypothetical protein
MSTSLYQSTVDPKLTNIGLFYKKEFYEKASNFLGTIQSYTDEVQRSIDFQKTKVANDVITSQADFFAKLDNELSSAQPQFAANWINLFNNALSEVKNQVGESVHYRQFSDSIGGLVKIENYLDDSTQLVSDVQSQQTMAPLRYGSSLSNKISPVTLNMMGEFSKKINLVFRKNIQNIQDTISSSTKAHGSNLVPDTQHFVRMKNIFTGYTQKIQTEFKSLYNVIDYYCRYNPRTGTGNMQVVTDYNITVSVEGNPINQDLLQNQLADTTSKLTTMKVLG